MLGDAGRSFGWSGSLQGCAPRWLGRRAGWWGSGKVGKSAATAGNTAGTAQVQGIAAVEGNTVPSPGSRRCPGWCPSPPRGRSRRGWLDFGCPIDSCRSLEVPAHCSRRGGLAGGAELVGRLGAPSPSASGAATGVGQVQEGCHQVQVGCNQVQGAGGCHCVQEQVLCCQGAQVQGSVSLVVDQRVLYTH